MTKENPIEKKAAKITPQRAHFEAAEKLRECFNEFAKDGGAFAIEPDVARSSAVLVDHHESRIADLTAYDLGKIHNAFEQEMLKRQGELQYFIERSEAMLRLLENNIEPGQTIEDIGFTVPAEGGAA